MAGADVLETIRNEDFVEYFLFPKETEDQTAPYNIQNDLISICDTVRLLVAQYESGYIWHRDSFNISTKDNDSEIAKDSDSLPSHLYGVTHVGNNIEDEWFIVYILLKLSQDVEGIVIRVIDNDGEFLLIEAAEVLPSWANPDTCQQRVYLYNGEVHIIPLDLTSKDGDSTKSPKIKTAIDLIRSQPDTTRASSAIQEAIQKKIMGYPEKIKAEQHRATAYVPVAVAVLLKSNPGLIAHAVQAFHSRDPIDLKACRAMRYFPPENCVYTSILFTRFLYAMISGDKYVPDKRTGWPIPKSVEEQKSFNLGTKVACGFEILVSQAKPPAPTASSDSQSSDVAKNEQEFVPDRGWYLYVESLKKKGYFQDLLEGSSEYNEKLKKAQHYYAKRRDRSQAPTKTVGQLILSLMSKIDYDLKVMRNQDIPPSDDESWLNVQPEDLDKILEERYGKNWTKVGSTSNPTQLSGALHDFLNHVSGLDGVEFPGAEEEKPTRPKRGIKKVQKTKSTKSTDSSKPSGDDPMTNTTDESRINFDSDIFASTVQSILDFVIPEDSWDLDSDSDVSGLGSIEDETEMDLNQMKPGSQNSSESELKQYMDQMDRELASSTMGQSFEKSKTGSKTKEGESSKQKDEETFDSIEDFKPVDIDMNALKNILDSYKSQLGEAGPASNLLGPMGIQLQSTDDESAAEE